MTGQPPLPIGSDAERAVWAAMARNSLHFYTRYTFARRKQFKWRDNWHHARICAALEDVFYGRTKRLVINIGPRYSKTEIAVLNFITWAMGHYPDCEFIHTSYSSTLAENNSSNAQTIMAHDCYREIFPDVRMASNARAHWKTTAGGVMYATGSGGSVTGFGAGKMTTEKRFSGAILIDDPHKAAEATSDTMRNGVIDWYQNTLASRTNNPDTPIILIMQRLHEEDLAGWLLAGKSGEEWTHLCLPALREENGQEVALWPWKHDVETLRQMERASPYVFAGQYQQTPAPLAGGIIKTAWFKWYNPQALPKFTRIVQSWDTAFSAKTNADRSACTTWGETDHGWYCLDIFADRIEFPELRRAVANGAAQWKPNALLIEEKASGQSLLQELRRETRLPVIGVRPELDKVGRVNVITPLIEAGRVFLPEGHPMAALFVSECAQFPNGKNDDMVDSLSQALNYLSNKQPMQKMVIGGF